MQDSRAVRSHGLTRLNTGCILCTSLFSSMAVPEKIVFRSEITVMVDWA